MAAFAFDWQFTTAESLDGDAWSADPATGVQGSVFARGIADGPDEDFEALLLTLLGALATATRSVRIVTPYFLPDPPLLDALKVAALRGVRVQIVLPERTNLPLVQWAQAAHLADVLMGGARLFLTPPPFDHSKLVVVDGAWSLIGSANWDPRSLRLNFEYVVECYSAELAATLGGIIDTKCAGAKELTHRRPESPAPGGEAARRCGVADAALSLKTPGEPRMRGSIVLGALALALAASSLSAQVPRAIGVDPPRDSAHPARMEVLHIPSGGVNINGVEYVASRRGQPSDFHSLPRPARQRKEPRSRPGRSSRRMERDHDQLPRLVGQPGRVPLCQQSRGCRGGARVRARYRECRAGSASIPGASSSAVTAWAAG